MRIWIVRTQSRMCTCVCACVLKILTPVSEVYWLIVGSHAILSLSLTRSLSSSLYVWRFGITFSPARQPPITHIKYHQLMNYTHQKLWQNSNCIYQLHIQFNWIKSQCIMCIWVYVRICVSGERFFWLAKWFYIFRLVLCILENQISKIQMIWHKLHQKEQRKKTITIEN